MLSRSLLCCACVVTLLLAAICFSPETVAEGSEPLYTFRVLTLSKSPTSGSQVIEVKDRDVLASGSVFRIEITPFRLVSLKVSLQPAQGEVVELLKSTRLAPRQTLTLPAKSKWYSLDEHAGEDVIEVVATPPRQSGTPAGPPIATHRVITHVPRAYFEASLDVTALQEAPQVSQEKGMQGAVQVAKWAAQAGSEVIQRVEAYSSLLGRLQPERPDLITRGANEVELFRKVSPGVVLVVTKGGSGSGSVISADGQVLTNWHVVKGYKKSVSVVFKPTSGTAIKPSDVYAAQVINIDEVPDLALLQINSPPSNLTVLPLGTMAEVQVGADVHAIGHPAGEYWTYTRGFVSQVRPTYRWTVGDGLAHEATLIQTQTPINPGSSGGPLLSNAGRLVGVNSYQKPGQQGINFAVAVVDVVRFLNAPKGRKAEPLPKKKTACQARRYPVKLSKEQNVLYTPVDTNCNGKPDVYLVDEDWDGKPDYYILDFNEDGRKDAKVTQHGKGPGRVWIFYDESGNVILVGYDYDGDGDIDRYAAV